MDEATDEHFDYTEWQRDLWNDLTIDEVFQLAADREKARNHQQSSED